MFSKKNLKAGFPKNLAYDLFGTIEPTEEDLLLIGSALDYLSVKDRDVIFYRYKSLMTLREISEIYGVSGSTAEKYVLNAVEKARKFINEKRDDMNADN